MTEIATVGVDLAKSVFQVHAIDAEGAVVLRRQLRRNQVLAFFRQLAPCRIGMGPVAGRITGLVSWAASGMTSASCRRPM